VLRVLLVGFDGKGRLGPGAKLAATIGALAPDCDLVIAGAGWDRYLQYHEAGTHTLLASPIVAAVVALCLRVFLRKSHFARLWCAALLGALVGHLGLDLISGADMMLFAPFWNVRLAPHLVAMADVLVIGIFRRRFRDQPAASQGSGAAYRGRADCVNRAPNSRHSGWPSRISAVRVERIRTDTGWASRRSEWFDLSLVRLRARRGRSARLDR
jgi:hypothetical protein